ncbi:MAG: hypothetical protein O3A00_05180 [Planctomycetota bacterium]|nr:hypothetical protein [Planctomycetota bacterium]
MAHSISATMILLRDRRIPCGGVWFHMKVLGINRPAMAINLLVLEANIAVT